MIEVEIGKIVRGTELGKHYTNKFIGEACEVCGKKRWVVLIAKTGKPRYPICHSCVSKANLSKIRGQMRERMRGDKNPMWKGGRNKDGTGYIVVLLTAEDFFYPMTNVTGYVREHRLVMAKHLGRCLHAWEIVHHKGIKYPQGSLENKQDNRLENLQLVTDDRHKQITILENKIRYLGRRLLALEKENQKLRK